MNEYDYFLAIAETGNVSRAAEKLYISQPSLSKQLRRLEEKLGVDLFDRSSYPLKLTEAGMIYLNYVRENVLRSKNLQRSFENLKDPYHGEVRVGLTPWRSNSLMAEILGVFWGKYPNIRVVLQEGPHQHLASLLEHDRVDFALTHLPNQYQGLTWTNEFLMRDMAVLAVNANNPLLKDIPGDAPIGTLSESEFMLFANEPFVMFQESQNIYEMLSSFLESAGVLPNVRLVTPNIHTAMNFVRCGQGIAFGTSSYAASAADDHKLRFFRLEAMPMSWDIAATYKKNRPLSSQARLLVDCIKSCCAVQNDPVSSDNASPTSEYEQI